MRGGRISVPARRFYCTPLAARARQIPVELEPLDDFLQERSLFPREGREQRIELRSAQAVADDVLADIRGSEDITDQLGCRAIWRVGDRGENRSGCRCQVRHA